MRRYFRVQLVVKNSKHVIYNICDQFFLFKYCKGYVTILWLGFILEMCVIAKTKNFFNGLKTICGAIVGSGGDYSGFRIWWKWNVLWSSKIM